MLKNRTTLIFTVFILSIASCKKDRQVAPAPIADFTMVGDTASSLTFFANAQFKLINNSVNADSFLWDFGNGITSTKKDTQFSYTRTGTYIVTLIAKNLADKKSESSKSIKVVEPVLKRVIIQTLNWNPVIGVGGSYIKADKANIWVEIQQGPPNDLNYTTGSYGLFNMPVIYRSPVATGVDSTRVPIEFAVSSKTVIDFATLEDCCGYRGLGFVLNLFAQDATGTYLLYSTNWSGVGYKFNWSLQRNNFEILSGVGGNRVTLSGDFE